MRHQFSIATANLYGVIQITIAPPNLYSAYIDLYSATKICIATRNVWRHVNYQKCMAPYKLLWRPQICMAPPNLYGATKICMAPANLYSASKICMAPAKEFIRRPPILYGAIQTTMVPKLYSATKISMATTDLYGASNFVWRHQKNLYGARQFSMAPKFVWRHPIHMTLGPPKFVWLHHRDGIKAAYKSSCPQGGKQI